MNKSNLFEIYTHLSIARSIIVRQHERTLYSAGASFIQNEVEEAISELSIAMEKLKHEMDK